MDIEKLTIHFLLHSPDSILELLKLGIDESYFIVQTNKDVARIMFEYFKKYNKPISLGALNLELTNLKFPQSIIDEYLNFNADEVIDLNIEHLANKLKEHKRADIYSIGLKNAIMHLNNSDLTSVEKELKRTLQELAKTESTQVATGVLKSEIGNVIAGLTIPKTTKAIMTGYSEIDDRIGGFEPGWLVLVAAAPKVGKTRTLINLACNLVKQKVNVLIFTLEVARAKYLNLCLSCFSKIPYSSLDKHMLTQEDLQKLDKVKYAIENDYGELNIIDTFGGCTPKFIQDELIRQQFITGIKYDVVIVDHGTMMRPNTYSGKDHLDQAHIAEDLRDIARKNNVTVLAAVQRKNDEIRIKKTSKQNQDASKITFDVGGESIGRSIVWYQTADVLFVIQNDRPDSLDTSQLRFRVISRYNSDYAFELAKDFNITSLISVRDQFTYKGL